MEKKLIYMDNAATTPVKPEVLDAMLPYFTEKFGNPSSIYSISSENKKAITDAREVIAKTINTTPENIYFTAGGSESDNWALKATADAYASKGKHIITTKIEHHAILHTCEYLETKGVPVLGYGTDELPAFYTRESGLGVDARVDTPEDLAAIFQAQRDLGLKTGMLVTNPIPQQYAMDKTVIDKAIDQALAESHEQGIHGKETTPFLLARVAELTGGDSLESNIQLVLNNARVAAKTAVALCK